MAENTAPTRAALSGMMDNFGNRILSQGEARIAAYMILLRESGATLSHVIKAARISRSYAQRVARKAHLEFPDYAPREPKVKK